jgi:hypothetical protein
MQRVLGTGPQELQLKVGTIYVLAGDLNKKITNDYETQQHYRFLPRIDLTPSKTQLPCVLQKQTPTIPAFALTINKQQGQTF